MTDLPAPKLLVNQTFKDTGSLARAIGWDLDFRQIDPGPLRIRATVFGHVDIGVLRIEFDRSFHQVGVPPQGVVSFGFPDKKSGVLRWNGTETPPGVLINFHHDKKLDCVNTGSFGGYVLSFTDRVLKSASEKLGFSPDLVSEAVANRFWNPEKDKNTHDQLRQVLQALEKVAVDDGDEGLGQLYKELLWKNSVFRQALTSSPDVYRRYSLSSSKEAPGRLSVTSLTVGVSGTWGVLHQTIESSLVSYLQQHCGVSKCTECVSFTTCEITCVIWTSLRDTPPGV